MTRYSIFLLALLGATQAHAEVSVTTVDFLKVPGVEVNAAGPLLVQTDEARNRLVVANTLSSSISIVDCRTGRVDNIPLGGRALQHLKSEAMTINGKTGEVYLIGAKCIFVVSTEDRTSRTIPTEVQFESVAVHEGTGTAFVAGRESKELGFLKANSKKLKMKKWLGWSEELINLNQTPPPPIRKVIADSELGQVIALDGFEPALHVFDAKNGEKIRSRQIELTAGARWHLAGYSQTDHCLFVVVETAKRNVVEAAKIDLVKGDDVVVPLPGFTEGVGIIYNPRRDEVYIPYDNHPTVHVVDFANGGALDEIKIPAYGNDGSAVDTDADLLYIASWAFGEVDVIDLKTRRLLKRVTGLGIIPHMFAMAFNPNDDLIYFPKGATAVNGTFGAAITVFDPETELTEKIHTGWAPIDLIELEDRGSFLVFNSEDQFAEVRGDGTYEIHRLPYDYPVQAIHSPEGDVYLSYGPHQSYWPTVYIWDAKNGILTIDAEDLNFYDRRIPRQAHKMVLDKNGALYFTQNNWGREEQFLGMLEDQVRVYEANKRVKLVDEVDREITQRILRYDPEMNWLYLVRVGEQDNDPSILQVVDLDSAKVVQRVPLGLTAADLVFDRENIYVANFDSGGISVVDKLSFTLRGIEAQGKPIKLCRNGDDIYAIDHLGNTLQHVKDGGSVYRIPQKAMPDNLFAWGETVVITSHSDKELFIFEFDPRTEEFTLLHRQEYPYGDTRFDSRNVSFYVRGQFGDVLFDITKGKTDTEGRLWVTDFLSGKLFILERG